MLATAAPSNPPPPTNPHRQRTAQPMLHPIFQISRRNRRRAMELIRRRRSIVVRRIADISALGRYEERERGRSRDVGAVNVGAGNVPSGASPKILPHARTHDERGELCGLFDGNIRYGAADPTAARQDAAVHVGNELNPAGHDDSGVTKYRGAIGNEAGAPRDRGIDESSYPQPNRLEGTCCFSTCLDNGESLVRDCGHNPQQCHTGAGRDLNFWIGPWHQRRRERIPTAPRGS
ncbi:hypothetical protein TcCL_ESM06765 [Trypanosoma cruzi]|nr:hypothetical protein TcCL_ESM06765 [Trypanosoma cruzi]